MWIWDKWWTNNSEKEPVPEVEEMCKHRHCEIRPSNQVGFCQCLDCDTEVHMIFLINEVNRNLRQMEDIIYYHKYETDVF